MAIVRALRSVPYQTRGKHTHLKSVTVDLPCSPQIFIKHFVQKLPDMQYNGQTNFKYTMPPSVLRSVFGENINVFYYKSSLTRRQIIGLIMLHYRTKDVELTCKESDSR